MARTIMLVMTVAAFQVVINQWRLRRIAILKAIERIVDSFVEGDVFSHCASYRSSFACYQSSGAEL